MNRTPEDIIKEAERLYGDTSLQAVAAWKKKNPGRPAIGHMPVYVPREVLWATGTLPVGIAGGGDQVEVVKGDACYQSYICHIPRSTIEMGLTGDLDALDGMVFPATCDVIRNLSGIWKLMFPKKYSRFLDLPQSFDFQTGGAFFVHDLEGIVDDLVKLGAKKPTPADWKKSFDDFNRNRRAISDLYALRRESPWLCSSDEAFLLVRAGYTLPVDEHTAMLEEFLKVAPQRNKKKEDRIRLVLIGSFCEQPPLGVLRTLERSGCYVLDDDLNLGQRWILGDVEAGDEPLKNLARAYIERSTWASTRYEFDESRGAQLLKRVTAAGADGVCFAAPSFCDPALLDQPPLQKALTDAKVPYFAFKYAENTGQFQGIREQAGTFSDSIKLWGTA